MDPLRTMTGQSSDFERGLTTLDPLAIAAAVPSNDHRISAGGLRFGIADVNLFRRRHGIAGALGGGDRAMAGNFLIFGQDGITSVGHWEPLDMLYV